MAAECTVSVVRASLTAGRREVRHDAQITRAALARISGRGSVIACRRCAWTSDVALYGTSWTIVADVLGSESSASHGDCARMCGEVELQRRPTIVTAAIREGTLHIVLFELRHLAHSDVTARRLDGWQRF